MGLRGRLLLLVLLPTIPALVLGVYTSLNQRHFGKDKAEKDAIRVAQLAAVHQKGLIEAARQHLLAMASFREARLNNVPVFEAFFSAMRLRYRDYTDFGLIETNGTLVACSYTNSPRVNLSDEGFFQRVLRSRELEVGACQLGPEKSLPSLVFGYPIFDDQRHLVRVLYAALDFAVLNRTLEESHLPDEWMTTVLDENGRILARNPDPEKWVGKSFTDVSLLTAIRSRKEGTAELREPGDRVRLCAFTPVGGPNSTLFVAAGIPLSLAYAETRRMLILNLAVLGGIAIVALAGAWIYADVYILGPLRALSKTTRQVAAGNLAARTGLKAGPGELNQLAHSFDEMAEGLQTQRLQNERLQAELEDRVKQRTAQLEHSNRELEAFSYSVSHDLRAPLRHIHGYVGRLQEQAGATLNAEDSRLLKLISDGAKRMGMLIDDLLAFSRMGRVELTRSGVSMDDLLKEALAEAKRDTDGRTIRWSIDPLPLVQGDRALLKQVWANLLSNAVKYTRHRESAEIKISSRRSGNEFEFKVQDNGAGFDMRYAGKLFRVFERLHRSEDFEGTGIGLATVRRIIVRHEGRTWAEGQVDAGASFYFTLPIPPDSAKA